MRILIIEHEIYLAQSIASKLGELGYACDMSSSVTDAMKGIPYDVVLLSTSLSGQDIYPVIEAYKRSVVILMVSYISNDTVTKPLKAGAKDYILKPFMIEELIRKIEHYQEYKRLKRQNESYARYLKQNFQTLDIEHELKKLDAPLFISSSYAKYADAFAFRYAEAQEKILYYVSLLSSNALDEIASLPMLKTILYVSDFHALKKSDHQPFFSLIAHKEVIVSGTEPIEDVPYRLIEVKNETSIFDQGDILPIEDYVRYIVVNYQHKFPDTELSKKLGISRKSLWEKRKKYGLIKKK